MKAMETEQDDLQFLGTCGIFKESIKIILTWPKIFIQITLAFILPNYCLSLAMDWISMLLISKNFNNSNSILLATKQVGFSTYHDHISNSSFSEFSTYTLMMLAYFIVSVIFSLLSSSIVAYTVASIYTCNEITFRKVITVIPKVWNRLVITYICEFCIMFALPFETIFIFLFSSMLFFEDAQLWIVILVLIMGVSSVVGFYYVTMMWQLAYVVSVLETYCGVKALKKSKDLIKGKMRTAFAIVLVMDLFAMPLTLLTEKLADFGIVGRLCFGILTLVLLTLFSLFNLVVKTILYLVCKSYHHESVDESCLADHLGFYGGEYAPLKTSEAMQLEHLQVV